MKEAMKLAHEALLDNRHYIVEHERAAYLEIYDESIAAVEKALAEQPAPVQGWKLVPVEPTQKMLDAPPNAYPADALVTWKAMLAAAPQPAQQDPAWRTAGGIPRFKPAQQEPVAHLLIKNGKKESFWFDKKDAYDIDLSQGYEWVDLYASPYPAPVLSAGPITPEMANWSDADKAKLTSVITQHMAPQPAQQQEQKLPEFFASLEYDNPGWDVVVAVYQRREGATPLLVHRDNLLNQQPAPVQQILSAFPLLDDEGLDEEQHHCEWTLQQDRKRLHAMLAAAPQPAQRKPLTGWIDPNDKTQKQYLPHIGEPVLFCHGGKTYTGKHTGGSFQSEVTNQYFNTWECHWMHLPVAHNIKEQP